MDYAKWKLILDIVLIAINAGIGLYVWWTNREKVTHARFEQLEKEVGKRVTREDLQRAVDARDGKCSTHQRETKTLEQAYNALHVEVSKLPSRSEIKELTDTMRDLNRQMGNLDGRMSGVNRAVDLINEFLIEQGGKK